MKIKESIKTFWRMVLGMAIVCLIYFIAGIFTSKPLLDLLKGDIILLAVMSLSLFVLHSGSYIEIKNDNLIVCQEYMRKVYSITDISRVYILRHFYLGKTLFMNYKGIEMKILVVANYNQSDIAILLNELSEKGIPNDINELQL